MIVTSRKHAVHIYLARSISIRGGHMIPLADHRRIGGAHAARAVGLPAKARRGSDIHHHFIPVPGFAVVSGGIPPPTEDRCAGRFSPEPGFGCERAVAVGIGRDVVAAIDPLARDEMASLADYPAGHGQAGILGCNRADFILERFIHVQDAGVAVVGIEDRGAVGLTGRIGLAPIQFDFLARVAFDGRYAHPDAGGALRRIPFLHLAGQRLAGAGGETDILSAGFRLAEIENILMQPHQQRETVFRGRCRQIRAFGRGEQVDGTGMLPARILGRCRLRKPREQKRTANNFLDLMHHYLIPF
jgi:hypothetical protein